MGGVSLDALRSVPLGHAQGVTKRRRDGHYDPVALARRLKRLGLLLPRRRDAKENAGVRGASDAGHPRPLAKVTPEEGRFTISR